MLSWHEKVAASHRHWERKTGVLIRNASGTAALQGLNANVDSLGLVDIAKERLKRERRAPQVVQRLAGDAKQGRRRETNLLHARASSIAEHASQGYRRARHARLAAPAVREGNIVETRARPRIFMVAHIHSTAMTPFSTRYL